MAEPGTSTDIFDAAHQINTETLQTLQLRHNITDDTAGWDARLTSDLKHILFDYLYPWVWPFATKAGNHIDPLHRALIKNRIVIAAEDPKLHLIWHEDTIYIKPLPDYLLNFSIWQNYLRGRADMDMTFYQAAAGFLRSYSFLIQRESDFVIAHKSNLLPKYVSFLHFQRFIQRFRTLPDDAVSPRYHYGQLRLNRLNWLTHASKLATFVPRISTQPSPPIAPHHDHPPWIHPWYYHESRWEFRQHIANWVAPLAFIFASLSLILSAMQVGLASLDPGEAHVFVRTSKGFAIATIVAAAAPLVLAVVAVLVVLVAQFGFAVRAEVRRRRDNRVVGGRATGAA
ncbi:hypothetical protein QBC37DRAFT_477383 [Rhypophila decipiens]|uniref:Uncharacterized protein n=1 Tax=Rhypophila decipiens TaxID=261697 RepID=A0AAN6YLT8_9PEZI|nr:hypothetical protein QBC37DRAFT_477383 [Rhypophila decipiens]